jgi:TatD DNase family protein
MPTAPLARARDPRGSDRARRLPVQGAGGRHAPSGRGYLVSVTPEVVYRERDRGLVETVPLESLLVESDGPWPYTGEFEGLTSGPWVCARVAEEVAKIKRLPIEETMYRLSVNTCQLFDLVWA